MKTEIFEITDPVKDLPAILYAADVIKNGGLVAFPTETVYGLGGNALDENAAKKIYSAKGRPSDNPLIVHISDPDQASLYTYIEDPSAKLYMDHFWPGPLTLVMNKKPVIPDQVTAGLQTVGLRCPSHQVARTLIREAGVPIAAPSANLSGRPSTTEASHVIDDLNGRVDVILCQGSSVYGLESTVLDITVKPAVILRPGFITWEDLSCISRDVLQSSDSSVKDDIPKAPGMKYRHYAPKAKIILVRGDTDKASEYIRRMVKSNTDEKACVLTVNECAHEFEGLCTFDLGCLSNPPQIAANLFSVLREIDKTDTDVIYSMYLSGKGLFISIMNRLKKAAGDYIVDV
ncbi:MAG TPA: threonylcarbamoyl-AMP synthase [Clostridiales bacterium]|nr:threonylcarbamoyl-AMP synthase [Clostridiales bacterium]